MFFFKQKTAYEMRMSDWSSDVCSSDLAPRPRIIQRQPDGPRELKHELGDLAQVRLQPCAIDGTLADAGAEGIVMSAEPVDLRAELAQMGKIENGRASGWGQVGWDGEIMVVARSVKKK